MAARDLRPANSHGDHQPEAAAHLPAPDYRRVFEASPSLMLILTPDFRIVNTTDLHGRTTLAPREAIVGRSVFEAFPDNPDHPEASGTRNLRRSLERVLSERVSDSMAVQQYDVKLPDAQGGHYEERHWSIVNSPLLDAHGNVAFIITRAEEVTDFVRLQQQRRRQLDDRAGFEDRIRKMEAETFLRGQELQQVNDQLLRVNASLQREIKERREAEQRAAALAEQLRRLNDELEERVEQRTAELAESNRALSAEAAQRRSAQERFRLAVESAPNAMVMVDAAGKIVLVNDQTERLFGYTRAELLGQPVELLVPERFRAAHPGYRAKFFAQPSVREMGGGRDLYAQRKDGSEFPVEIGLNPIHSGEGFFVLSAIVDITERKRAEEAQRQSELRFRGTFNQTFEFVNLLDLEGRVVDANQPALDFRRLNLASVVGRFLWETPWFDISPAVSAFTQQAVTTARQGKFVRREIELLDHSGHRRTFDFSVKPLENSLGKVELLLVEARDVTDQKRLEEQLRQSQKMEAVGQLAGGVAHDFNNLLTVILGYSDMMADMLAEGDPMREMVQEVHKAGSRAASLTRQLLAFSRKQVLVPVVVNLNTLLADMGRMLGRLIGEDIDLAFRPAPDLWKVRVDSGQVEQIVMNLAVNARDAMPQGGKLTIETANVELDESYVSRQPDARVGEHVLLAVTDTGHGIEPADLTHIFEPFFSTKGEKGTGLGLSTVYGIVKQSGGHIAVYSEVNCGTSFKIYFPRIPDEQVVAKLRKEPGDALRGTETILLVEDEAGVRSLARRALERHGYRVLEASHGAEAILLSEQHPETIHLLVTDVIMPNVSGRELAERLVPLRPKMKVLFMSGYMDDAIVRHGLLNASVPFIQKPYTPDAFVAKVRGVLDG